MEILFKEVRFNKHLPKLFSPISVNFSFLKNILK